MRSEKMGMGKSLLSGLLLVILGGGIVWIWQGEGSLPEVEAKLPSEKEQELLVLRGENRMLRAMLGQVDGKVTLLGPTNSGRKGYAKVVWDETLQSGYLYATQLTTASPSEVYQLSVAVPGQPLVKCCTFSPDAEGRVQMPFAPSVRLLGVNEFVVTLEKGTGANPPRGERILEARP